MTAVAQGFSSVRAQRREPPDVLDFFPTPLWASRVPAAGVLTINWAWECACGQRHMAGVIEEFARDPVIASDVFNHGYGTAR